MREASICIAWGVDPGSHGKIITKTDALQRVAAATTVRVYTVWDLWELAAAFGLSRNGDFNRVEWYASTLPQGEALCVSKDGESYWVQDQITSLH